MGPQVSLVALVAISAASFFYHLVDVYIPGDFVPLFDPTGVAVMAKNFYNTVLPSEVFLSSFPSSTQSFYPPGFFLPYNVASMLFGEKETIIRWVGLMHQVAVPSLMFYILARFTGAGSFISVAVSLMALFYSIGNAVYYPDYSTLPYVLLLIIFLLRYNEGKRTSDLWLAGIMSGAIVFTKHNIGAQYFIASLFAIIVAATTGEGKDAGKRGARFFVTGIALSTCLFYLWLLRKTLGIGDILFFFMPIVLICSITVLLVRKGLSKDSGLFKSIFRFAVPVGVIVGAWLATYFCYFGVEGYIYRLVSLGYSVLGWLYHSVLEMFNIRAASTFIIFANLLIGTLGVRDRKYYAFLIAFNVAVAGAIAYTISHSDVERVASLGSSGLTLFVNTFYYQFGYLANPMYLAYFLNISMAGHILIKLSKGHLKAQDKIPVILLIFSIFALNSMYPSNDFFHAKVRLPLFLLLFGAVLSRLRDKTPSSRRVVFILLVSAVFAFSIYGHIGFKAKLIRDAIRGDRSPYNDRLDVYLDRKVIAYLDNVKEATKGYGGQEAFMLGYGREAIFYFTFDLRPAVPYFVFEEKGIEKELPLYIMKRLEEKKTRLVIMDADNYGKMESGNPDTSLFSLYKYIKDNYGLKRFVESSPELEKQQLMGYAVMVRQDASIQGTAGQ